MAERLAVAVVVPCYRVRRQIAGVLAGIVGRVAHVYVVDDACPERTGAFVRDHLAAPAVTVLFHRVNQGVGGAVLTGYRRALADGHEVVVKMDGDGQMDPAWLAALVAPVMRGEADYAKGNRFIDTGSLAAMPRLRLVGNAMHSMLNKPASGYWGVMDPNNGYTAIHRTALASLPLERLARRYFFESDMLFQLGMLRAVVADVPIPACYPGGSSNIRGLDVLLEFPPRLVSRIVRRFAGSMTFWAGLVGLLGGRRGSRAAGVALLSVAFGRDAARRPTVPLQRRVATRPAASPG